MESKISDLEAGIMERYKNLPDMGVHGMRLDYLKSNNDSGLSSPKGTIYYHVISCKEKKLAPAEFVKALRRSISVSVEYALSDLPKHELVSFRETGEIKKERIPAILYLIMTEGSGFVISPEKEGECYGPPYPEIEYGNTFSEGAWALKIPKSEIAETITLDDDEFNRTKEEMNKINSLNLFSVYKSIKRNALLIKEYYEKAAKTLLKLCR